MDVQGCTLGGWSRRAGRVCSSRYTLLLFDVQHPLSVRHTFRDDEQRDGDTRKSWLWLETRSSKAVGLVSEIAGLECRSRRTLWYSRYRSHIRSFLSPRICKMHTMCVEWCCWGGGSLCRRLLDLRASLNRRTLWHSGTSLISGHSYLQGSAKYI